MTFTQILQTIANANNGIIATRIAESYGISRAMLSKLCKKGTIRRIAQGQYMLANQIADELFSICIRSDRIICSHETALYLHGLLTTRPLMPSITAPADKAPSLSVRASCKVYYIKPALFELGRTTVHTSFGHAVAVYDLDRSICDIIRHRRKLGPTVTLDILKKYVANPNKDLDRLKEYARQMGLSGIVTQYLQVLL